MYCIQSPRDHAIVGIIVQFDDCNWAVLLPDGGLTLLETVSQWHLAEGWRLPEGMEGEWYSVVNDDGEVTRHLLWANDLDKAECHCFLTLVEGGCIALREVQRFSRDRMRWIRMHQRTGIFGTSLLQIGMMVANDMFDLWRMEITL